MGARTLEARLTARLLVLGVGVLAAVGVAAVMLTERVLDASDTAAARFDASQAVDALSRELAEGDAPDKAVSEVVSTADGQRTRLTVRGLASAARSSGPALPDLATGACATVLEDPAQPWRACAASGHGATIIAAVPMAPHRTAVVALARGMFAVVVLAMIALWLAVRGAVRGPIAELTALVGWADRVVETQEVAALPASRTQEVAKLEVAFDTLVRRLLDALARERANSAHIAHELRTPLTAMVAELEALHLPDRDAAVAVQRVRSDAARLAAVIDAILVLSDARPAARCDAVVNVADLARELTPRGIPVEAPDEALVEGDEHLVALALRNLLDNAGKYGAGVRSVHVSRDGTNVRVAVVDGGPGLDERARAKMFDRYWRGSADGAGSGLGLALVRAVAERHGGHAEAGRGRGGQGLEVSFTLDRLVGWHEGAEAPR
ncbi:MAG: sensor histidine kinase [Polyangiaceae bacterium]